MSRIRISKLGGAAEAFALEADQEGPPDRPGRADLQLDHYEAKHMVEKLGVQLEAELGDRPDFLSLMRHFRGGGQVTGTIDALSQSPQLERKAELYFHGQSLVYETTPIWTKVWRSIMARLRPAHSREPM